MDNKLFYKNLSDDWEDLGDGVKRKIAVHLSDLMLVYVRFDKGAVGALHEHHHTQTSYVKSGVFKYKIGKEEREITEGDSCIIPPNTLHGCVCIEPGEIIDSFTPQRDDFLS